MSAKVNQDIQKIKISDLNLWSENPRDPVNTEENDLDIIKRAFTHDKKWNIKQLIKKMGLHYDFSELPTVVLENKKFIVYDGNRRIVIIKLLQNPEWAVKCGVKLVNTQKLQALKNLLEIPCNVCDRDTAITNIERKHITNGTWKQLERDYFEHNFRFKEKSVFLKFEEATGLISSNPELNENIMKRNILTERNLQEVGFGFDQSGNMTSVYDSKTMGEILEKIVDFKKKKIISSRTDYNIKKGLEKAPNIYAKLRKFSQKNAKIVIYDKKGTPEANKTNRQGRKEDMLFGENLLLKKGKVNDIYRDVDELYRYYQKNKAKLSVTFPSLVRMALRLLIESASGGEDSENTNEYIKTHFKDAREKLSKDEKTTLHTQSIESDSKLISLLHIGAHNYSSSSNMDQTMAMSIILGKILTKTHGRK